MLHNFFLVGVDKKIICQISCFNLHGQRIVRQVCVGHTLCLKLNLLSLAIDKMFGVKFCVDKTFKNFYTFFLIACVIPVFHFNIKRIGNFYHLDSTAMMTN